MNNLLKFATGIFLTLAVAWLAFVVGARVQFGDLSPISESLGEDNEIPEDADLFPMPQPGLAELGSSEYLALGCSTCHTQQVRMVEAGFDVERGWGQRPSMARDYIYQKHVMLGNTRIGPDLTNLGTRILDSEWLHKHLFEPQAVVPESVCPPSPFLYDQQEFSSDHTIELFDEENNSSRFLAPSSRATRIVAYLQSLKQDYELPEMAFIEEPEAIDLEDPSTSDSDLATNGMDLEGSVLPTWLSQQLTSGKEIYSKLLPGGGMCVACHQPNGQGLPGAFPPLAGSDWVLGNKERLIKISIHGLQGEIAVNGEKYVGVMQGFGQPLASPLDDQQIADVLTYIRNEWGNSVSAISPEEVKAVRDSEKDRELTSMWTAAELNNFDN